MEEEIVDTQKSDEQNKIETETDVDGKSQDVRPREIREATPGAPIVRSNTPRPFMYNTMTTIPPSQLPDEQLPQDTNGAFSTLSAFPAKPPSAPPLPEEPDDYNEAEERMYTLPAPDKVSSPAHETQAFAWLFEYGLEMDSTLLNTPERLDGLALLYGPVVLKGYRLVLGSYGEGYSTRTLATVVPDTQPDAEVWGVLYRIPHHVTQEHGDEPALLEVVHVLPKSGIQAMHVVVRETYRNRVLPCITYGCRDASTLQHLSSKGTQDSLDIYVRRLTSIAEKQKLPKSYIKSLVRASLIASIPDTPSTQSEQRQTSLPVATAIKTAQDTEPLVLPIETLEKVSASKASSPLLNQVQRVPIKEYSQRWFMAFAIYLFCLLFAVLTFAVVQGVGILNNILNENVTLLSVPWLVLIYGFLGGCISSIITLGRTSQPVDAPAFVLVIWFTRPFVGAILALFAYLLISSGLFIHASTIVTQHKALLLLVGALAGLCEGWLFLHKR